MCVHHPEFGDNRMYAAFIKGTNEMLIGGGNDKLLPFVSLDPKNKPRQILVDGIMYNVEYRRVNILVYQINENVFKEDGPIFTYTRENQTRLGRETKPNIESAIDEAAKISNQRYEEILHDAVANAKALQR